MMKIIICCLLFFVLNVSLSFCQKTQHSVIFQNYKKNKSQSLLPDFSYVGYHCGEKATSVPEGYKIFNVVDFGAKPDDEFSDRDAIQRAITAANNNGSGIVFFPKGRFLVNEDIAANKGIFSKGSRIIFKGSGSGLGGTELFMKKMLLPGNPKQMWTGPPMFTFTAKGKDVKIGGIVQTANVGAYKLKLQSTTNLKTGDWVALKLLDNSKALIDEELGKDRLNPKWTYLVEKGVNVCMYYQVVSIKDDFIQLNAPLAYKVDINYNWSVDKFANAEEVGVEDIAFVGNWKEKFEHHASWKHDSGFNLFMFSRCTNSWMRNCRFTDCNVAAIVGQSANVTVMNCVVTGNAGHEAITSSHSTNVLLANLTDEASQWHSFGVANGSINTVLWHCVYPPTTSFETHSSQPRNTLLDNVKGGLLQNHGGGAIENMPNHMKGLVIWNYTQTNKPAKSFEFWPVNYIWWKIPSPIISGFVGNGTTFKENQLGYMEGVGQQVFPSSLYEAQLQLRLTKLPNGL